MTAFCLHLRNREQNEKGGRGSHPKFEVEHVDRFIKWLNEAFAMFQATGDAPEMGFFRALRSKRYLQRLKNGDAPACRGRPR